MKRALRLPGGYMQNLHNLMHEPACLPACRETKGAPKKKPNAPLKRSADAAGEGL
jgi:hypothetical protein